MDVAVLAIEFRDPDVEFASFFEDVATRHIYAAQKRNTTKGDPDEPSLR